MTLHNDTRHFDVVGPGYVSEHHADEAYRHRLDPGSNAVGGAFAWLAFYAIAFVVVVTANLQKAGSFVVAAVN